MTSWRHVRRETINTNKMEEMKVKDMSQTGLFIDTYRMKEFCF